MDEAKSKSEEVTTRRRSTRDRNAVKKEPEPEPEPEPAKKKVKVELSSSSSSDEEEAKEEKAKPVVAKKNKVKAEPDTEAKPSTATKKPKNDSGKEINTSRPKKAPGKVKVDLSSSSEEESDSDNEKEEVKPSKSKKMNENATNPSKRGAKVTPDSSDARTQKASMVDVEIDRIKATSSSAEQPKKGLYCSMCWGEDTEDKLLFQCKECDVIYHNDCYRGVGLDSVQLEGLQFVSNKDGLFVDTCYACQSVGTSVRGRTKKGMHHTLDVESRPYECCLCSVNDPSLPLPMHPVYDRNNGRHLILERGKKAPKEIPPLRLAWCHTLCAQVIGGYGETGGCVYSVLRDGTYGGYAADDDDRSIGSAIEQARKDPRTERPEEGADPEKTLSLHGIHHFCIVMMPVWKAYLSAIQKHKKFTCVECCVTIDPNADDWRMAIPCMCHEDQEPKNFRRCSGNKGSECLRAMHVGCAMWGRRINGEQKFPPLRRVYFEDYGDGENLGLLYCNQHAKLIRDNGDKHGVEGCNWRRFPGMPQEKAFSVKGSNVPRQDVRIENENDLIESDRDSDDEDSDEGNYDLVESDSGDEETDSDLESISDSISELREDESPRKREEKLKHQEAKKRKRKKKKRKRKKKKRKIAKEETARDRLEQKMNKKKKSGLGGGTEKGFSGRNSGIKGGLQKPTASTTYSQKRRSLESVAVVGMQVDKNEETKEKAEKPPAKKIKSKTNLMSFIKGGRLFTDRAD